MAIVQFPVGRLGDNAERTAFRQGLAGPAEVRPLLRLIRGEEGAPRYCAACAAPVDFGAVWRGVEVYCSVECSLGSNRPA
ncbi:MAG TPA: hypothetical protein VGA47_02910 [Candidatus Dormibacteraeota bacterium]